MTPTTPATLAAEPHGLSAMLARTELLTEVHTPVLGPVLHYTVELTIALLVLGMVLCLYRIFRGPGLPDRVLATDALALHVVGLVVALAIYLGTTAFLDVALVVAIIGFAGTLAFAQYIAATGGHEEQPG